MKHPDADLWSLAGAITPAQFNVIGTEQMSVFVCGQGLDRWLGPCSDAFGDYHSREGMELLNT